MSDRRDEQRMAAAIKAEDSLFATYLVSSYSPAIVRWAAARRITPNQVTVTSVVLALTAAAAFATGGRVGLVAGAMLVQLAFTADCVDGQLARYTATSSRTGGWLDAISDRFEESVIYGGLAVGGARSGDAAEVWLLALCALALLALRHQAIFGYATQHASGSVVAPSDGPVGRTAAHRASAAGVRAADALERSWLKWVKRTVMLPIGERFALISVTAAFGGPRVTFVALLAWGGLAAAYVVGGRLLRSLARARSRVATARRPSPGGVADATALLDSYRDDGPLAHMLRRLSTRRLPAASTALGGCVMLALGFTAGPANATAAVAGTGLFVLLGAVAGTGRLRWVVAPLLHAGEYMTLAVLASRAGALPAAFALLVIVTAHHYVLFYLGEAVGGPSRSTDLLAGGWDGRTVALTAAALGGVFAPVAAALALWATVVFGVSGWQRVRAVTGGGEAGAQRGRGRRARPTQADDVGHG